MRKLLTHPILYVAILTGLVFLCFGRTLGSYFLADDFGEVAYVSKIFEGDMARLWSNFTGNYMQVPSMAVYRPWLLMSLVFDYAVWQTNAFGYYLTNLLHYLTCTICIFALVKLLTPYWGKWRSTLAATFSAAIFAVNPLHCESVSWVVGRVDIVCLSFYLLGLVSVALYARSENKKWLILTFASFWLGILTKEMAIALPVTATALAFLWGSAKQRSITSPTDSSPPSSTDGGARIGTGSSNPHQGGSSTEPSRATAIAALQKLDFEFEEQRSAALQHSSLKDRIAAAMPVAIILFASTAVYFVIRYACLGTITGGYTGSIGQSQFSGILQKWTDLDTIMRIVFPLNHFVFGEGNFQKIILSAIYVGLISLSVARLLFGAAPKRWLVFLTLCSLTALAPIYQLWGIGYDLEGSRFVFFLTVPLAMLFPIILFAPMTRTTEDSPNQNRKGSAMKLVALSGVTLTALAFVFAKLTMQNNVPWIHAGKQTQSIHEKAMSLSKSTPEGKQVGVVGIPKREGGAHMILNGTTFRHLITPPFSKVPLTGKILTFEPVLFGNPEKVDTGHFKEVLGKPNVSGYYVWNMDKKDFVLFDPGAPPATLQGIAIPFIGATASTETARGVASFPYTEQRGNIGPRNSVDNALKGMGIRISGLKLHPSEFDYVVITARSLDKTGFLSQTCKIQLESVSGEKTSFDANLSSSTPLADGSVELRIPLSDYWRFYAAGEIENIIIDLPPIKSLALDSIDLLPAGLVAPIVKVENRSSSDDGSFLVDRRTQKKSEAAGGPVNITVNTTNLMDAKQIEVQILKKNFFFDNLTTPQALAAGTLDTLRRPGSASTFTIPEKILSTSGYFQLRFKCINSKGEQVGEYSYPITLRVVADHS